MWKSTGIVALSIISLSACVSISQNTSNSPEEYNLHQAFKNIAISPREYQVVLLQPELLNKKSFEIISLYEKLDTTQEVSKFKGQPAYKRGFVSESIQNNIFIFEKHQGDVYYDVESFRLLGSKNITRNSEAYFTKLYDIPKTSPAGATGKVGEGYFKYGPTKSNAAIKKIKWEMTWSLNKIDDTKAELCEISILSYSPEIFDSSSDCYLINKQGDVLDVRTTMTLMPKKEGESQLDFKSN